ncbi:hypothetical protein TKK_0002344 [Trichogramma kaykai]
MVIFHQVLAPSVGIHHNLAVPRISSSPLIPVEGPSVPESEDHQCPQCEEKDVFPDQCWPNQNLRKAVSRFNNETSYNNRRVKNSRNSSSNSYRKKSSSTATAETNSTEQSPVHGKKSSVEENEEERLSIEDHAVTPMVYEFHPDQQQQQQQQQQSMYSPGDERLTWSHYYYPSSVNSGPWMTPYTYIAPQPGYAQQTPPICQS